MKLRIGQRVEWKLKDGRILKGVVGGYTSDGARLEDVTITFPDGAVSIARVMGVAFKDIVVEEEKPKKVTEKREKPKPKKRTRGRRKK